MKVVFFMFCFILGKALLSQHVIKFDYDAAGNLTQRYIQIVNLRLKNNPQTKDSLLSFKVYPNPARDHFFIEGSLVENKQEAKVFLYNVNGAVIKEDFYNGTKKEFSLQGYKTGIYFLEIRYSKKQSSTYRLLITE
jgi:hypothetical protein